jgi:hypothetical protein
MENGTSCASPGTPPKICSRVFLDNEQKVAFTGDIINGIFGGNPVVYWGVTSATGRLSNNHEICIKKLLFADASSKVNGR